MGECKCRKQDRLRIAILEKVGHDLLEGLQARLLIGIVEDVLDALASALETHHADVGNARDLLDRDGRTDELLDGREHAPLARLHETERHPLAPGATDTTNPMHVDLG